MTSSPSSTAVVWLATYLLHSSLLLGGLWMVLRLYRIESHVLKEWLWKLAAVAGLVTTTMQVSIQAITPTWRFTLVNSGSPIDRESTITQRANDPSAIGEAAVLSRRLEPSSTSSADSRNSMRGAHPTTIHAGRSSGTAERPEGDRSSDVVVVDHSHDLPSIGPESTPMISLQAFVPIVVAALGLTGALRIVWQMVQLAAWTTRWTIDKGPARDVLRRLSQRLSVRHRVELLSCDTQHEPFATGLLRWRVVLPRGIEAHLRRDELEALLAHELAHLVRRDPLWSWIGCALCSCLAIQPLNFLARRRWNRESEFQCDQWSVKRGIDPLSLARCLTQVASWRVRKPMPVAFMTIAGEPGHLTERVERLVNGPNSEDPWSRPRALCGMVIVACLTIGAFGLYAPGFATEASMRGQLVVSVGGVVADEQAARTKRPRHADESTDSLLDELAALQNELETAQDELQDLQRRLATAPRAAAGLEQAIERLRVELDTLHMRQSDLRRLTQLVRKQRRTPQ